MNKIKQTRESLGLRQSELAKRIGMSQPGLNHYESGRRRVNTKMANKILGVFKELGLNASFNDVFPE